MKVKRSNKRIAKTGITVYKFISECCMNYESSTIFFFQFEKPKTGGTEPGSCEEHASLVKHSDTNGTNV